MINTEIVPIPYGYCQCGCEQLTAISTTTRKERGQIKGEPVRFIQGHNARLPGIDYEGPDYLVDDEGCWRWQKGKTHGYGKMYVGALGRQVYAHRWYWEQRFGSVPVGKHLDHLCRNPDCVNPEHLEPVSPTINAQRGDQAKLTPAQVLEIRRSVIKRGSVRLLARKFGVAEATVADVLAGRSWQHVRVCESEGRRRSLQRRRSCVRTH